MLNLLKRKKLNILKTYNINVNSSEVVEEVFVESPKKEESKQTARFNQPYELSKETKGNNFTLNPQKVEEYDSFVKYERSFEPKVETINDFESDSVIKNEAGKKEPVNMYEKLYQEISKNKNVQKSENSSKTVQPNLSDLKKDLESGNLSNLAKQEFMNIDKSKFEYLDLSKNEKTNSILKLNDLTSPEEKLIVKKQNLDITTEELINNQSMFKNESNTTKNKITDKLNYSEIDHRYNFDKEGVKNTETSLIKNEKNISEENQKILANISKLIDDDKYSDSNNSKINLMDKPLFKEIAYDKNSDNTVNKTNLLEKPLFKEISYDTKLIKDETQDKINKIYSILDENSRNDFEVSRLKHFDEFKTNKFDNNGNTIIPNTAEVLNMALELKESKKTIEAMRDVIEDLRKDIKTKEEQYKKDIHEKISTQKFEFENILQRQNGLVESLLAEKKKLSTAVEELTEQLNNIDKSSHKKIQQIMENFEIETKKNKDAWFQAEKLRRKKWEETKVKEIKDMTVKGLEPEIERILANHKQEIIKMEDRFNEDLRRQREKLNSEFERRLSELKERSVKEKEEALEHERSLAGQRIRNQNERLEDEYNEERRRWNSNLQAEIHRLETLREQDKKLYGDQIFKIEERNKSLLDEKENYYKFKISDLEKRFEDRSKFEGEEYKLKFDKEKEKFIEEKTKEFENKVKEMKQELLKDRDRQIQIILDKLGEETVIERKKIHTECEAKADSINKQLRQETEQMRQKMQELSDKISAESKVRLMLDENIEGISRKLQERERDLAKKEKVNMELSNNLSDINNRYSNITREFNKEKLEIESEFKLKYQKMESDFKLINEKLDSSKNYYENKINDLQNHHKAEILEIEERIKKSFNRKEEVIKKLQDDVQLKDLTIQKYEDLMAKQRKELLLKNN
jgi:5-azacytidine-induced protein 1